MKRFRNSRTKFPLKGGMNKLLYSVKILKGELKNQNLIYQTLNIFVRYSVQKLSTWGNTFHTWRQGYQVSNPDTFFSRDYEFNWICCLKSLF